jgi:hypothetical protein
LTRLTATSTTGSAVSTLSRSQNQTEKDASFSRISASKHKSTKLLTSTKNLGKVEDITHSLIPLLRSYAPDHYSMPLATLTSVPSFPSARTQNHRD